MIPCVYGVLLGPGVSAGLYSSLRPG